MNSILSYFGIIFFFLPIQTEIISCPPTQNFIDEILNKTYIPGVALIVVNRTDVLYEKGFGYLTPSVIATNRPIDPRKTIFPIASISKTLIVVAAMQLVENNQLNLDADLNRYVPSPLKVVHPLYPDHSITMRHLLTHTSGLGPNFEEELTHYLANDDFLQVNLTQVIFAYMSKTSNWLSEPPGAGVHYSNMGASLAALIIVFITQQSFEEYAHTRILQPLGINRKQASYRLSDFQDGKYELLEHYVYNSSWLSTLREWVPSVNFTQSAGQASDWLHLSPFSIILYPAGLLRTSAYTLSLYLQSFLNNFPQLLTRSSSIEEMLRPNRHEINGSQFGLIWILRTLSNRRFIGHGGSLPGATHYMLANEDRSLGVIVLSNGDASLPGEVSESVYETIVALAMKLFDCFE